MSVEIREAQVEPQPTIEIPRDIRGRVRWSILRQDPDQLIHTVETLSRQFLAEHGELTTTLLSQAFNNSLSVAITRYYPGKWKGLRERLELPNIIPLHVTDESESWGTISSLSEKLGVSKHVLKGLLQATDGVPGKSFGKSRNLYPESVVLELASAYLSLPKIDDQTGVLEDTEGLRWVPFSFLTKHNKISHPNLRSLLEAVEIPTIRGRNRGGKIIDLYSELDVLRRIRKTTGHLSQIDNFREFVDEEGQQWVGYRYFYEEMGLDAKTVKKRLKGLEMRIVAKGKVIIMEMYPKTEALARLEDFKNQPKEVKKATPIVDSDGQEWASISCLQERFSVSKHYLLQILKDVKTKSGKNQRNMQTEFYNLEQVSELVSDFLRLPEVNRENAEYLDSQGEGWVATRYFLPRGLGYIPLRKLLAEVPFVEGLDKTGHKARLYNKALADRLIDERLAIPQVDKQTGIYVDQGDSLYVHFNYFRIKYGLDYRRLERLLTSGEISCILGRDRLGKVVKLYKESDLLSSIRLNRTSVSTEQANEQLEKLLEVV